MAKIGDAPLASRYDGIMGGPRFVYKFDAQSGIPVDGTNASLRDMSPFRLRLVVPDALVEAVSVPAQGGAMDFLTSVALGMDESGRANNAALARSLQSVVATTTGTTSLETFVAQGRKGTSGNSSFDSGLTDAYTAADIALQVQLITNAEPLVLLVNPTEMSITHTKIQSYQSRTRFGYQFEAWGEDQPSITFSGTTAGFVAGAIGQPPSLNAMIQESDDMVTGYQAAARRDSAAWQNFANLYQFYRSNGYIYDTIGKSEAHLFIGHVAIDYDQVTYLGQIENFSFSFDEGMPLRVEFSLEFKVSRMYDTAKPSMNVAPLSSSPVGLSSSAADPAGLMAGEPSPVEQSSTPFDAYDGSDGMLA